MTLTLEERATMLELLDYPNPEGLHPNEARWREFARLGFAEYDKRIRQLEALNKTLAAQVDRTRPVVEAAVAYRHERPFISMTPFDRAVDTYEREMAQLAKEM